MDLLLTYFTVTALSPTITHQEQALIEEVVAWFETHDLAPAKRMLLLGLRAHLAETEATDR
jgi:hypothetical protein